MLINMNEDIISNLTGGQYTLLDINIGTQENNLYNVYIKFDNDPPLILRQNISLNNTFNISLHPNSEQAMYQITCSVTGKRVIIYTAKQNKNK